MTAGQSGEDAAKIGGDGGEAGAGDSVPRLRVSLGSRRGKLDVIEGGRNWQG